MQVAGRFAGLDPDTQQRLRAEQPAHDITVSAFCPEGSFSYAAALTRFTVRYLLEVTEPTAVEADEAALVEAELLARELLDARGLGHRGLTTTATCLDDVRRR